MDFAKLRRLIEAGFSDEEITQIISATEEQPKPAAAPDPAPAADPDQDDKPIDTSSSQDMINAIKSLEMTIRASNLINSTIPTVQPKSADDALASWLDPKKSKGDK